MVYSPSLPQNPRGSDKRRETLLPSVCWVLGGTVLRITVSGQPWERHYVSTAAKENEAQRGQVIHPRSQSQEAAEWGRHSQVSDSKDSLCFSGTINTLWETQLLAGKRSCVGKGLLQRVASATGGER